MDRTVFDRLSELKAERWGNSLIKVGYEIDPILMPEAEIFLNRHLKSIFQLKNLLSIWFYQMNQRFLMRLKAHESFHIKSEKKALIKKN